ncbi:hypothetical protein DIPPA_14211 [Diplonema papillatum]|nr:hypothetical protein DIPPA_14211 [Diplonema papillatum]
MELLQTIFAEICRKKRELERGDIPAERNHPWRELDHETCRVPTLLTSAALINLK